MSFPDRNKKDRGKKAFQGTLLWNCGLVGLFVFIFFSKSELWPRAKEKNRSKTDSGTRRANGAQAARRHR